LKKDRYLTVRLPPAVEAELRKVAEAQTRTLAGQILFYIQEGLKRDKE